MTSKGCRQELPVVRLGHRENLMLLLVTKILDNDKILTEINEQITRKFKQKKLISRLISRNNLTNYKFKISGSTWDC